jgi:UDP-2,3-diacylglucosamine pyrophosphatase LpxH
MDPVSYNTLILSDLHLGAETSRAREAAGLLKQTSFQRLILLGDIFADLNFARLKKEHWKFLGLIRKLSNPRRGVEVVWVEGNHDHGLTNVMSHLVGVRVYQEYGWDYGGLRHLAIHGHQFDGFQVSNVRLSRLGTLLYLQLQKVDLRGKPVTRMIDRLNTRWLRMSEKVAEGALKYARQKGADRVFCGHTHDAMHVVEAGIHYYNCGGWVGSRLTYITVNEQGVSLHEYNERLDDRHPGQERSEADWESADVADEAGLFEDAEYEGVGG